MKTKSIQSIQKSCNSCITIALALGSLLPILAQNAGAVTITDGILLGSANSVVAGSESIASGDGNHSNVNSIAIGNGNTASFYSIAMGDQSVSNWGSLSCGGYNTVDENSAYAVLVGEWNAVENSHSSALFGSSNGARSQYGSAAIGVGNTMWFPDGKYGDGNILLGEGNQVVATETITSNNFSTNVLLGSGNISSTSNAYILGEGNDGQSGTVTLGTYAAKMENASLIVGTGTSSTQRANGLIVLKNGNVTIPSGILQLGSENALTSSYLSGNGYLKKQNPNTTVASDALLALGYQAHATASNSLAVGEGALATANGTSAIGSGAHATGVGSLALSPSSSASGYLSLAMQGGLAGGDCATSIGVYSSASGVGSVAIGYECETGVNGNSSTAIGKKSKATALYSNAIGAFNLASDTSTTAIGVGNVASKPNATAVGYGNSASKDLATAIGYHSTASGLASSAFGRETIAPSSFSTAMGSANLGIGASDRDWNETDPVMEVGNGADINSRSNAITTLKNGQTTLINKAWKSRPSTVSATADPSTATTDSGGEALVVDGHTRLRGKVVIEQPQGDISMGIYGN